MDERRKYRFRAWVEPDGRMLAVLSFARGGVVVMDEDQLRTCSNEHVTLMQYSGLHDASGAEIYEGDIVRLNDGEWSGSDFRIDFSEGAFRFVALESDDPQPLSREAVRKNLMMVSGNIYEN